MAFLKSFMPSNIISNHFMLLSIFLVGSFLNFVPLFINGYSMVDPSTKLYPDYIYRLSGFEYTASVVASLAGLEQRTTRGYGCIECGCP